MLIFKWCRISFFGHLALFPLWLNLTLSSGLAFWLVPYLGTHDSWFFYLALSSHWQYPSLSATWHDLCRNTLQLTPVQVTGCQPKLFATGPGIPHRMNIFSQDCSYSLFFTLKQGLLGVQGKKRVGKGCEVHGFVALMCLWEYMAISDLRRESQ